MDVPYLRPSLPDAADVAERVSAIVASGTLTKGGVLADYERALAERLEVEHVVATSSGTVGLAYTYKALGFDGPVIVPSFTFLATVTALSWAGATPVFADVDRDTFSIDPDSVRDALHPGVRGIVAVTTFGLPCDVAALTALAREAGVPLVFDSAHGVGSFIDGIPLGRNGAAEVFSTTPTKTLITGEGGFVTTNDAELAATLRVLIEYGNDGTYDTLIPGLNGRLSEVHAAMGLLSLARLDEVLAARHRVVDQYRAGLADVDGIRFQQQRAGAVSSFKDLTVLVLDSFGMHRDRLAEELARRGIETRKYFYPAVHRHRAYKDHHAADVPNTEWIEQRVLSLPVWADMTDADVTSVVEAIRQLAAS